MTGSGGIGSGSSNPIGNTLTNWGKTISSFYGVDSNGHWTNQGGFFKWLGEGFGAIDGANASRAQLNLAKDQAAQAQTDQNNLIAQQQWNRMVTDQSASVNAGAARANASVNSGPTFTSSTPLGFGAGTSAGKDFLGL